MIHLTERLFEHDSYIKSFNATVLSCEEKGGSYLVTLDRTAFFPEGGGQPADKGEINGIKVLDVQENKGIILHKTEAPITVGEKVEGHIDWALRFSRMQSHCAEHIISGVVHSLFGYDNVGFHLSDNQMFVDFSGPLTQADIDTIEEEANLAIFRNLPIYATYPSKEEIPSLDYRSKLDITEGLRLITIEGVDCCACCAPHPARTGEIGIVKVVDFTPYKGGTRVELVAGIKAVRDYSALNYSNKALMKLLSARRNEVSDAVTKLSDNFRVVQAEKQELSKKLALSELSPVTVNSSVYAFCKDASYDELRFCSNSLMEKGYENCLLFSNTDGDNYIYTVSSVANNANTITSALNKALDGKGGGKPNYTQGKLISPSKEAIINVIEKLV